MDPDWGRAVRDQCKAANIAFFMKQMARGAPIPPDLRIREFPSV
jgi:protein gp37